MKNNLKKTWHCCCCKLPHGSLECSRWSFKFPSASNLFLPSLPHVGNSTIIPWMARAEHLGVNLCSSVFLIP